MESFFVLEPLGIIACICLLGVSACLATVVRRWGWIAYAIATLVVLAPAVVTFLYLVLYPHGGADMVASWILVLIGGPRAAAWLAGFAIGMRGRCIRRMELKAQIIAVNQNA